MSAAPAPSLPTFVPEALAASDAGIWDYDVLQDRLRGDPIMAGFFGLSKRERELGVPIARFVDAIHPDDRALVGEKRAHVLEGGGLLTVAFRAAPSSTGWRWLLARGRYSLDDRGEVVRGRGVIIDLTESRHELLREGPAAGGAAGGGDPRAALDRVAQHALATRRAIDDLGPTGQALRQAVDVLLLAIGRRLSAGWTPGPSTVN